jgi:hypothetical protein
MPCRFLMSLGVLIATWIPQVDPGQMKKPAKPLI